jgi:hypothetical protein
MPLPHRRRPSKATLLAALLALAAGSLVLAIPLDSFGQPPPPPPPGAVPVRTVKAEVMVLLASQVEGRGSIDPAIGNLPQLREPPYSSFNSYHLLDRRTMSLQTGRVSAYTMPHGRLLELTLEPSPTPAYLVQVGITHPNGNGMRHLVTMEMKTNKWYFMAGQHWNGGTIWVGITLHP